MKKSKILASLSLVFGLCSCDFVLVNSNTSDDDTSSNGGNVSTSDNSTDVESSSHNQQTSSNNETSSQESEKESMSESITIEPNIDLDEYKNLPVIRFSSTIFGSETNLDAKYKMKAPYTDTYDVSFDTKVDKYEVYDENGVELVNSSQSFSISLVKDQIVYVHIIGKRVDNTIVTEVVARNNKTVLPYDPINVVDPSTYQTSGSTSDPLDYATINYVKRDDGLYVNCNNPEKLTTNDLNKALTRQDVSNKEVFFTFEHNNMSTSFYYGYQVRNTGDEDIYVTVKNIGFQLDGAGSWLGEKEWIDFYNTKFETKGNASWDAKQQKNFVDYFGFSGKYEVPNNQPITYKVPAGKHIYVMGGTTSDSYRNLNVFDTANKRVSGGCSNGAVLFQVAGGQAEGAFFVYNDASKVQSDNKTHQGYVVNREGVDYGSQYVGYDNCNGVVDNNATWVFNDKTPIQSLPVIYKNYYGSVAASGKGTPYGIINSTEHTVRDTTWTTHINPQNNHRAVGTDMTKYYTIDSEGNDIVIDSDHYDGKGNTANIGNWMIDYIDNFTFVNQGDNDRTITIEMGNTGSLAVMVRDENGKVIEGTPEYTIVSRQSSDIYSPIVDNFSYTVTIPAHSVKQFSVEYNLLANSNGNVTHEVKLVK